MVAGADYNHAFIVGDADIFFPRQRCSAVYLYVILKENGVNMKKIWAIILILIVFSIVVIWQINNNPSAILARLKEDANINTGDLIFKINLFGIIPIGQAVMGKEKLEEYNGSKVYHLTTQAQTSKAYSWLFNAHVNIDSFVDAQTLRTVFFKQRLSSPGKESSEKDVYYDIKNNTMTLRGVQRQILPNTQDPLSVIFNLRHMDFSKVNNFEMNINTNQKNYILRGLAREENLAGDRKTFIVDTQIKRRENDPYHKSSVSIIFLKEKEENIPILIRVFASGALITAKLVAVKH